MALSSEAITEPITGHWIWPLSFRNATGVALLLFSLFGAVCVVVGVVPAQPAMIAMAAVDASSNVLFMLIPGF